MTNSTLNIIPNDIIASGMVIGSVINATIHSIVFVLCSIISPPSDFLQSTNPQTYDRLCHRCNRQCGARTVRPTA